MSGESSSANPFNPKLIAGVIGAGVIAFVALWALMALGPQISSGNDGGGHALSKAAPGFAAIVDLAERSGGTVAIRRSTGAPPSDDWREMLILTPTHRTRPDEIARLIEGHGDGPVLLILPKWQAGREPGTKTRPGWVSAGYVSSPPTRLIPPALGSITKIGRHSGRSARAVTATLTSRSVVVPLPRAASQYIEGTELDALIAHPGGGAIVARHRDSYVYVLADPDLVNNLAFQNRDGAKAALMLIDAIAEDANADALALDVTLNGLGGGQNLLRFAFVPPFIGITLCLIAAGLLALWQAWIRFGPALKPLRAIPISKAALIANSADLVKQAGRELDGADGYVTSVRSALARRLHVPPGLDDAATDRWIDRLIAPGRDLFSTLARRLPLARNTHEMLADAQALHQIRKDMLRDT